MLREIVQLEEDESWDVSDLFCGAGGFSEGAEQAIAELGKQANLIAVNHWPIAIESHKLNHPTAQHYVEDLTLADPLKIVSKRRLDLLLASPSCVYHSNARGGRPINDQKRMDPWAVIRWLTVLDVRCLIVENVPEFCKWSPLCTLPRGHHGQHDSNGNHKGERCDRPDPKKRGLYFEAWFNAIIALGYQAQWRMLNAADFGDATTRTRFFLVARKDGLPIVWPEPTHAQHGADAMFGNRKRWRAAREVIDWSNRGRSILDHPKYKKTPLSENTRLRMAEGFQRFGGPLAPLYVQLLDLPDGAVRPSRSRKARPFVMGKQASPAYRDVDEPLPALTTEGSPALIQPVGYELGLEDVGFEASRRDRIQKRWDQCRQRRSMIGANRMNNPPRSVDEPMPPATTAPGGGLYVVEVTAEPFLMGKQGTTTYRDVDSPMQTVTTKAAPMLIEPAADAFVLGQQSAGAPHTTDEPMPTVAGAGAISLVEPTIEPLLIPYYRTGVAHPVSEPVGTVSTHERYGLVLADAEPFILSRHSNDLQRTTADPIPTATGSGAGYLVEPDAKPFLVPHFGERDGQKPRVHSIDDPTPAITSHGAGALVDPKAEPFIMQNAPHSPETVGVRSVDDPMYTIVGNPRLHVIEPDAMIVQTDQTGGNGAYVRSVDQPTFAAVTKQNQALAEPCLVQVNHGDEENLGSRVRSVNEPLSTITSKRYVALAEPIIEEIRAGRIDKRRLVIIDDRLCMLDIRFRMLENSELAAAMGFTTSERQYEFVGNKGQVTTQIGNAVAVGTARALVRSVLRVIVIGGSDGIG